MPVEIAVIGAQRPFVLEALKSEFEVHDLIDAKDKVAALQPIADRIRGVATNAMSGFSAEVMAVLPKVEICTIMGVGLETTNLAKARERGIVVTTTPVLYDDVSDLGVILAMCACRRIAAADRFVRAGRWLEGRMPPAQKFSRKRAGIMGLGRIGNALAPRLQGFGMTIGFYDPMPKPDVPWQAYGSPLELAQNSDILFLTAAGGPGVRNIVEARDLRGARPQGRVRQHRARLAGRRAGAGRGARRRAGSAPPGSTCSRTSPRCRKRCSRMDNVVLTPHIASNTEETMQAMGECLLDNMRSWFAGNGPVTPVA